MRPVAIFFLVLALSLTAFAQDMGPSRKADQETKKERLQRVWKELRNRYDKNQDDRIDRAEYDRGDKRFDRLDRDGNGFLSLKDLQTADDEEQAGKVTIYRPRAFAKVFEVTEKKPFKIKDLVVWFWLRDLNEDGVLSAHEMGARGQVARGRILRVFDPDLSADVSLKELRDLAEILDQNGDGLVDRSEVESKRLAKGEGPKPGELAPDFDLEEKDGKRRVRLSSFRNEQPVALIFGSYT